jgi:hypothetical protein
MKLKGAGLLPLFFIILLSASAWCDKLVEVTAPIIKFRLQPSATSDSKGFARKGQRLIVDGESGPWFQIRLYNRDIVWIPKDAVTILESTDPVPPPGKRSCKASAGRSRAGGGVALSAVPADPGSGRRTGSSSRRRSFPAPAGRNAVPGCRPADCRSAICFPASGGVPRAGTGAYSEKGV